MIENIQGCFVVDGKCKVNHCCKREMDCGCVCQGCVLGVGDGWLHGDVITAKDMKKWQKIK